MIFFRLFSGFSIQAAETFSVSKKTGIQLTLNSISYSPGDIIKITGHPLESTDWPVLQALTTDYHLVVETPNTEIPAQALQYC